MPRKAPWFYVAPKCVALRAAVTAMATALALTAGGVQARATDGDLPRPQVDEPLIFSVVGDVPYDSLEIGILQQNFDDHDRYSPADFLVHVGDIKLGVAPCDEFWYESMATLLRTLSVPAFIVPGDNEWTDCLDRVVAWQYWTQHLMGIEESFCGVPPVEKQPVRPENFAFVLKGVLCIGINLVGGPVDRGVMGDDADWVHQQLRDKGPLVRAAVVFAQAGPGSNHNTFFDRFVPDAVAFGKPVLYAQGDGHVWKEDQPFAANNVFRIQVERGLTPPVQVTVEMDGTFHYNRDPWPAGTIALDRPPCADAGSDLNVPSHGVAMLHGKASDDGEPLPAQFDVQWSMVDGPDEVEFADDAAASTTATFEEDGTYVLRLTASDGQSVTTDETVVRVGVSGPNDAPVAQRDFYEVDVDNTLWVTAPGVLGNDFDADGDVLVSSVVQEPAYGALTLETDGSFSYVPTPGYAGLDRFVYRVSDTVADVEAEVWIGIGGMVRTFVVTADAKVRSSQPLTNYGNTTDLRVDEDLVSYHSYLKCVINGVGPVRGGILRLYVQSASSDGGGVYAVSNYYRGTTIPWTETGIKWSNAPEINGAAIANAGAVDAGGWIDLPLGRAIRGPGTWSLALRNASTDGAAYASRESSQPPELLLVALPVGADFPPVAAADAYATNEDEVLAVAAPGVLTNDVDEDLDVLTVSMASPPTHGSVALGVDGSFTYTPALDFAGSDAFAYVVDDGRGGTDTGIVTLTVAPMNDPPVAVHDVYTHRLGETLVVTAPGVLANDGDADGDALTATLVSGPAHGTVNLAPDGSFVYAPGGANGTKPGPTSDLGAQSIGSRGTEPEIFVYEVHDGVATMQTAVTIRTPHADVVAQVFVPIESGGRQASKTAASCAPDAQSPAVTVPLLTFQIVDLGPSIERAVLRLWQSDAKLWLERDVTATVTGDGILRLDPASFFPAGLAFELGSGGHPPQLIVVTAADETNESDPVLPTTASAVFRTQLERVLPNPSQGIVRVEYSLAQTEDVDMTIYNARGQRVRALAAERQAAGRRILYWDGTDARGVNVPAGIYFLRARLGSQVDKRKLVVAR